MVRIMADMAQSGDGKSFPWFARRLEGVMTAFSFASVPGEFKDGLLAEELVPECVVERDFNPWFVHEYAHQ